MVDWLNDWFEDHPVLFLVATCVASALTIFVLWLFFPEQTP